MTRVSGTSFGSGQTLDQEQAKVPQLDELLSLERCEQRRLLGDGIAANCFDSLQTGFGELGVDRAAVLGGRCAADQSGPLPVVDPVGHRTSTPALHFSQFAAA